MRIVITGGAGFIGSHIAEKLVEEENEVIVIDNLSTGSKENIPKEAEFVNCDVNSIFEWQQGEYFEGADAVLHYAALKDVQESLDQPHLYLNKNIMDTYYLLNNCAKAKVPKVIFASTSAVYGHAHRFPTREHEFMRCMSPYAISKLAGEQLNYCFKKATKMQTVCLRLFNVYGPRMTNNAISIFADNILNNKKSTIYGGNQKRDFIHVDDVVNANIAALHSSAHGVFNIGSGDSISIKDLYIKLCDVTEKYEQKVNVDYKDQRIEPNETLASITRAYRTWKWKPLTDLKTGLKSYVESLK